MGNEKKTLKKTNLKIKNNKKLKLNEEKEKVENTEVSEEELNLQLLEKLENNKQKNTSFMYLSWFVFVPLVLLIFVMTFLSIIGFLILILNSSNDSCNAESDKKEILRGQINQISGRN